MYAHLVDESLAPARTIGGTSWSTTSLRRHLAALGWQLCKLPELLVGVMQCESHSCRSCLKLRCDARVASLTKRSKPSKGRRQKKFRCTSHIFEVSSKATSNGNTMPSKLSKVQKHVRKKKGDKINSLHENSRDARRLRRAGTRDDRVARGSAVREKLNRRWIDRIFFCQDRLPATLHPLELEEVQEIVEEYLARHDEELEQLKAERRAGRPPSTRQTLLEQQKTVDAQEYESGLWLPNLQDEETLVKLDNWQGDWTGLANMRFVRLEKRGVAKESQFPPRGAS